MIINYNSAVLAIIDANDCLRGITITAEIPIATEFIYLQMGFQTLNRFSLLEQVFSS